MFGITKTKAAKKPEALVADLSALFGEEAKSKDFDLEAAVKKTVALSQLSVNAAQAFGEAANSEEFDFVASVETAVADAKEAKVAKKLATTLAEVKGLFGEDAEAKDFDLKTAVQGKIDRVAELEAADGAEATIPEKKAPTAADKVLKEYRTSVDAELDAALGNETNQ